MLVLPACSSRITYSQPGSRTSGVTFPPVIGFKRMRQELASEMPIHPCEPFGRSRSVDAPRWWRGRRGWSCSRGPRKYFLPALPPCSRCH